MKGLACYAILLLACVFTQVHGNCPSENGTLLPVGTHYFDCSKNICDEKGDIIKISCGVYQCKETIGYRDTDFSKPYPECCGGPICKE